MAQKILLITPPFTQLNTPYPATAYLKGFLNTIGIQSFQADLGIEVVLHLLSKNGLQEIFSAVEAADKALDENSYRIYSLRNDYLRTINPTIQFLQGKNATLANAICNRSFLPEASRFAQIDDLEWAFGNIGLQDKAKHLATLYLEDIGDFIQKNIDEHFGFSRYAERLGRAASSFNEIELALNQPHTLVVKTLHSLLSEKIELHQPTVVGLSVPFPGNLFGALQCGKFIKQHYPKVKVILGGGYANTELRRLEDERVFKYIDYVTLDDGEAPLQILLEQLSGTKTVNELKRTFICNGQQVQYVNGATEKDIPQRLTGTPDYSDLPIDKYISVIEVANPMHRMWSDGRWNKLTLAHGCYWGKCSFCDVSLNYIKDYEPITASIICDRIETIIAQTGETGFHFVDEAAPPALLRDVSLEIIRRNIAVSWWTNIRFEKSFTDDLVLLMRAAGCVAVAGGLEVASDRLLTMMKKGVTVAQVARVANSFTQAGIMVHAYLMYGFPTQTMQETIDSLEIVRQLFENGALQSGFWHRFAMTSHSPVGMNPAAYGVSKYGPEFAGFADNDLFHNDPSGAEHDNFDEGLKIALYNYMHGAGFELPLSEWFNHKIPKTSIRKNYIEECINDNSTSTARPTQKVVWINNLPDLEKESSNPSNILMEFVNMQTTWQMLLPDKQALWLQELLKMVHVQNTKPVTLADIQSSFEQNAMGNFDTFLKSAVWLRLRKNGLLLI